MPVTNFFPFARYTCVVLLSIAIVALTGCDKDDDAPSDPNSEITARDLLSANQYDELVIEVQHMPGQAPTGTTLNNLATFLEARLNKPAGISFVQKEIASPGKASYSADDIRQLEATHRSEHVDGKILKAYFLFVDGDYAANSGSSKVLGIAYGATSMAIFEKTVREYSGGLAEPPVSALETTVVLHEFGHILGLVNNGTSLTSSHQDTAHGKHCTNDNCLMYYSAETSDIVGYLTGTGIPQLDDACINDLKNNGGK